MTASEPSLEEVFASREFLLDPHPAYQRLLAEAPIWVSPQGRVFVSSHALVTKVLTDAERFPQPEDPNPSFHSLNPPEHTRLRRIVGTQFTPRATERIRHVIEGIVDELISQMEPGVIDLHAALSYEVPTRMICGMLGVPYADHERWAEWADAIHAATSYPRFLPEQDAKVAELRAVASKAAHEEREYFRELVRERQVNPGDDIISDLAAVIDEGTNMTEEELLSTMVLLLGGGHHTSIYMISTCLFQLLRNPDQFILVRDDPGLIPSAVEESIRFDSPHHAVDRLVGAEPVTLNGIEVQPGTRVTLLTGAANRDPEVFENPNAFIVTRPNVRKYVSFGLGAHYCLGAPLARAEGETALRALLQGFQTLELVDGDPVVTAPSYKLRAYERVPIRVGGKIA